MKRTNLEKALAALALGLTLSIPVVHADEGGAKGMAHKAGDAISEGANDTKRAGKKAIRSAKDETCELVNGKMECAGKKLKHKAENAGDKVKDAAD